MISALLLSVLVHAAPARPVDLPRVRKDVNAAVKRKQWPRARELLRPATRAEDAALRVDAWLLLADVEARAKDEKALRHAAMEALAAADTVMPSRVKSTRQKARKLAAPFPSVVELLSRIDGAERLARRAEAWPDLPAAGAVLSPDAAELQAALDAVMEARLGEPAFQLRGALALARAHAGDRGALDLHRQAASWTGVTSEALRARLRRDEARIRVMLLRKEKSQAALDAVVRALHQQDLAWATRVGAVAPHTRSPFSAAACADVDAHAGAGTCRKAHAAAGLPPSWVDFSRRAPQPVLGDGAVAETQAEYGGLLDACARRAAMEDPSTRGVTVELVWAVQPDGRADGLEFTPRRMRGSPLEACIREALGVFRYVPYRSQERRVVAISLRIRG